ncbi:MAG: aminoglycoside phosphotransferase family protein [Cyanomargarita calcarea GSE-NOS-MK-12-04C]|jgi:thiamine kinase-like enzyme|uniref:Aminoglycoside phosphotransferase family protein n=1 Tax=Cyanomargarita calcarea GSE-NOS-MK-12-04C TaxID=2839659 RepID=A0A951UQT9_9CYAN|nr:aminoglycoside phosphotransferase family protein [Cyanomargarita calcarea GSE-NOS-MK-12-04C]
MVFSLSSHNVIQYLLEAGLSSSEDGASGEAQLPASSKNFNLLATLLDNRKLLIKQERCIDFGDGMPQEFFNEWLFHQLLSSFPVLGNISAIASLLVHFDEENSILVRNYLTDYLDLAKFYRQNDIFPEAIASAIGNSLAALHRATFNRREYRDYMSNAPLGVIRYSFYNPAQGVGSFGPEIFGMIPKEALKFYVLYQRFDSLESAIADLANDWNPCCLTHNDLKLENILVHSAGEQEDNSLVRLIDWEACAWGDPAFDLGTLLASYLRVWLDSLVVDPILELEESLRLAMTPLEVIQPSILALLRAYLNTFPMILEYRRDFIVRVVQFAGLAMINQIQELMKCRKYFENTDICILQVAKSLLTMPEQSVLTIFGISEAEIIEPLAKFDKLPQPQREQNLLPLYYGKTRLRGC